MWNRNKTRSLTASFHCLEVESMLQPSLCWTTKIQHLLLKTYIWNLVFICPEVANVKWFRVRPLTKTPVFCTVDDNRTHALEWQLSILLYTESELAIRMWITDATLSVLAVLPCKQLFFPHLSKHQLYGCCGCSCSHKSDPQPEGTFIHLGWPPPFLEIQ